MSDPRLTPANGRVAHLSLKGRVKAARFCAGDWQQVTLASAPVLDAPDGSRQRELLLGERFCVLETRAGHSFGYAARDGYVGYVPEAGLGAPGPPPSHRIGAIRSYALERPDLKNTAPALNLSFASMVHITRQTGAWSETVLNGRPRFIPTTHLRPAEAHFSDPVAVAEMFLGTPYLWGGNSAFGLDCSGLVQAALLACGVACPGDSDQQQQALGADIDEGAALQRGDLLFWKGHVAICVDDARLIHANATAMAVAHEGIAAAIRRIEASGEGPVLARKRLVRPENLA